MRRSCFGYVRLAAGLLILVLSGVTTHAANVPEFSLRTTTGQNLRLSEHRGEIVVLGFWARWCGDCRQAMQAMNELDQKYGRNGVLTLGVNVGDTLDQADAMSRSLGLGFATLVDTGRTVAEQFNLGKMPLIVLIDRDGVVRFSHAGYQRGDDALISGWLRQLINE